MAVGVALLVGASRVYLGEHHASDALAGWLVGTGVAASCCALYECLAPTNRSKSTEPKAKADLHKNG